MACKRSGVRVSVAPPGHVHISNAQPVTGPASQGHLRGSFAARLSAVGLLTCGGDEDGPVPSAVLGIGDVSEVTSSGRRGFRGLPGGTHCTLQDHPLARCQRGRVTAWTAESLCDRVGPLAAPGISYRFCRVEWVACAHAYVLIGMFTRGVGAWAFIPLGLRRGAVVRPGQASPADSVRAAYRAPGSPVAH